ncbi:MAG TPA: DUF2842 domain-containing protein [Stellaceae bacterium]|nr:DUF2842 domain-containing protein [Stellaceae bacterium]
MRLRMLYGTVILLVGLLIYALVVMVLAATILPAHWAVQVPFYTVAGIAWIFPAARVTRWMQDIPPWRGSGPE